MIAAIALAAALDRNVDALVIKHQSPSVSVAIVDHGKLSYARTSGAAGPRTAYAIGSVSKMFTAVSIFQLIDRGQVSLDDPLAKFLPAFPRAREITVRELLGHRSGVPNYGDQAVIDGDEYVATRPSSLIARFGAEPLDFSPGTKWAYSNSGYVLLGQIVERVSHQSLEAYEIEHLYKPAHLTQTAMGHAAAGMTLAAPYSVGEGPGVFMKLAPSDLSWFYACGDIVSTATDLARFDMALMSGKLISAHSFAAMQTVVSKDSILKGWDDGLGMFTRTVNGKTISGHHGGEPGYTADNELIPGDGFAAIVLDNGMANTEGELSALLTSVYGTAVATATPAVADFAVTDAEQRLLAFYVAVGNGTLDHTTLTKAMSDAMNAENTSQVSTLFKSWGPITGLAYVDEATPSGYTSYTFTITCKDGKHAVNFSLDGMKKIAGIFFPK